jgi:hyaluronan synthase
MRIGGGVEVSFERRACAVGTRTGKRGPYIGAVILAVAIAATVIGYKLWSIDLLLVDPIFAAYGLVTTLYLFSRVALSLVYQPAPDRGMEPSVAVVVPAFNEEEAIERSVEAILAVDYPPSKLEVVVVNDGSTDGTPAALDRIAQRHERVKVVQFGTNRGKRAAMAAGIRATTAEIVTFVDSDSVLAPDAVRWIVQDFADPDVGAVAGHADVLNAGESWIARMQAFWYFIAFRVYKAAESVYGTVTCCSGCFSAYRREAITSDLVTWEHQRFLGRPATVGDDRALTNLVLGDWKTRYQVRAHSATLVPSDLRKFLTQQARWKRSWTRESVHLARHIWRKHPIAAAAIYASMILPLIAPLVLARILLWLPLAEGSSPLIYLGGISAMGLLYGLLYAAWRGMRDTVWLFGILFVAVYLMFLVWQTYYSMFTVRRTAWGTRPTSAFDTA